MGWLVGALILVYVVGVRYVARRYFARRHGLSLEKGELGVLSASWIGAAWPVAIFLPTVREPELCSHHRHVLERNNLRAQIDQANRLREQGL
jgi:hypothetical protein